MTSQLEKLFMHWIFKNPAFFKFVSPHYFGNDDIKFIYECALEEWNNSTDKVVPSMKEMSTLVQSKDKKNQISPDLLKIILKIDWNEYRDEFIQTRFKAWILSNSTISGLIDSIELIKNIDKTDYDKVLQNVENVKALMGESTSINLGDINIGVDFDDPDAHNQMSYANKITTGYQTMDAMLNGGWDRKTLNVLMGEVNNGKCSFSQTLITVKNKKTNKIQHITLEKFFELTKSC